MGDHDEAVAARRGPAVPPFCADTSSKTLSGERTSRKRALSAAASRSDPPKARSSLSARAIWSFRSGASCRTADASMDDARVPSPIAECQGGGRTFPQQSRIAPAMPRMPDPVRRACGFEILFPFVQTRPPQRAHGVFRQNRKELRARAIDLADVVGKLRERLEPGEERSAASPRCSERSLRASRSASPPWPAATSALRNCGRRLDIRAGRQTVQAQALGSIAGPPMKLRRAGGQLGIRRIRIGERGEDRERTGMVAASRRGIGQHQRNRAVIVPRWEARNSSRSRAAEGAFARINRRARRGIGVSVLRALGPMPGCRRQGRATGRIDGLARIDLRFQDDQFGAQFRKGRYRHRTWCEVAANSSRIARTAKYNYRLITAANRR